MVVHIKIWIVLLTCFCASIEGFKEETFLQNLPGYAVTTAIDLLNSTRCRKEMEEYRDAVYHRVLWSMRMLDASGQPSSGFMSGNNYWQGTKYECQYLSKNLVPQVSIYMANKNPIYNRIPEPFPPFELNFFSAHIRHNSSYQYSLGLGNEDIIVLGLCLPASCSEHEVGSMLNKIFDDGTFPIAEFYSMNFQLLKISNLQIDSASLVDGKIIVPAIILLALIGFVIAATFYDCLVHQNRLKQKHELLTYENNASELKNGEEVEEKREHLQQDTLHSELVPPSRIEQIFIYFSAYSNIQEIFKLENRVVDIAHFHGLKVIAMLCIVVGHTTYFAQNIMMNKADGSMMTNEITSQIFNIAMYSVETFFYISGYLVTYTYLEAQKREKKVTSFKKNAVNFAKGIVQRYIRITPAYVVTILVSTLILTWQDKVSLWYFVAPAHDYCSKYWWRNLLYINNFFHWDELCINWSWYLANDIQFYIFGLFLLILTSSYYYTSVAIGVATLLISVILNAYMTYAIGFIPTYDMYQSTLTEMYIRPWMRIQPYMIGMGTAMVNVKLDGKLHLPKKVLAGCWFVSMVCLGSIVFGSINRQIPLTLSIIFVSFSRLAWCMALSWITITCATNNAGVVQKLLSLPYWVPFSRVSLCVYLLNPIIIIAIAMSENYPWHPNILFLGILGFGICVCTYVCAFLLSIIVEVPVVHLLRMITSPKRNNK